MRCCLYNLGLIVLVMFENFAKLDSPRSARLILAKFPNITCTNNVSETFSDRKILL